MPSTATDRLNGLTTSVAVKAPCRAVSTTALTLSGEQTVGGVACVSGDRVLYALSGGSVSNGIWVVSTGAWSRAADFDGNRDVVQGTLVGVIGDNSALTLYRVTTSGDITIGTTSIAFEISGVNDSANAVFASDESYAAGSVGERLARVIYVTDSPYLAPEDNATSAHTAIQQALDEMEARGGGTVYVPWPSTRYLLTTGIKVPSGVELIGLGSPTTTDITTIGQQFRYTGADAAISLKDGESDLPGRGFSIRNIGVELDTAGATGFRFRRCRDGMVQNCAVDMDADSQIGFHLMGERDGGTYSGVFDCTFMRLRSYAGATHTSAVHYKLSGTDGDGQCNGNSFFGIAGGGSGTFIEVGPSLVNTFMALEMEAPGAANDFIHCLAGASYNSFYDLYAGDAPSGYTGKIMRCDNGSPGAQYNVLYGYNAGANVAPEDLSLGAVANGNFAYSLRGDKYVSATGARVDNIAVQGEAFNRIEHMPTEIRFGDGTAAPVKMWPGYAVETTDYSSALGTFTPNVNTGRAKFVRFNAGASGTLTIAAPTNMAEGDSLEFFFYNNSGGSLNLTWNAAFVPSGSFPTSISNGARLTVLVRYVATSWWYLRT